ncbi:MAG: hypothetical protein AAF628_20330 [Planctomycetota bacterium]
MPPALVISATAPALGDHALPLPVPAEPTLHGGAVTTQLLVLDGGASGGIAARQGLELRFCR